MRFMRIWVYEIYENLKVYEIYENLRVYEIYENLKVYEIYEKCFYEIYEFALIKLIALTYCPIIQSVYENLTRNLIYLIHFYSHKFRAGWSNYFSTYFHFLVIPNQFVVFYLFILKIIKKNRIKL